MSDLSDDINDMKKYHDIISKKIDAVFGSRFISGSKVYNYPLFKKILNRIFNNIVKLLFFLIIMILLMHLKFMIKI